MAYYKTTEKGAVDLSIEMTSALAFFKDLDANKFAIERRLLRTVGQGAKTSVKRYMGKVVQRRTGTLYKSIYFVVGWKHSVYVSTNASSGKPTAKDGRNARYGYMLAYGWDSYDQNEETMTFNINGKWIRKHHIHVEGRDWFEPGVFKFLDSPDCNTRMDKELKKQIDYWEKKTGGTK